MERDLKLVKEILARIEKFPFKIDEEYDYDLSIESYTEGAVKYHIYLLHQANYIEGAVQTSSITKHINVVADTLNLTWSGHEFLDTLRNETVWEKLSQKGFVKNVPFDTLFSIGKNMIVEYLKKEL